MTSNRTLTPGTTDAALVSETGSILDGLSDAVANVVANRIDLKAAVDIGSPGNDLEINSSTVGFMSGRLYSEAGGSIYLTETANELVVLAAKATTGLVRLTVPDTNAIRGPPFLTPTTTPADLEQLQLWNTTPSDLDLIVSGNSLVAQNDVKRAAPSTDATRQTLAGIWALTDIYLWIGDDLDAPATTEIVAGGTITIRGDTDRVAGASPALDTPATANADAGPTNYGTHLYFAGRVGGTFDLVRYTGAITVSGFALTRTDGTNWASDGFVVGQQVTVTGIAAPLTIVTVSGAVLTLNGSPGTSSTKTVSLFDKTDGTLIFGHTDVDVITFDHTYLGASTRAYGSYTAARGGLPGDGEDRFIVDHLQTMDSSQTSSNTNGDTLTLDGQGESDTYTIYTWGSQQAAHHYVINVLDTGAEANGVDVLDIYGYDSPDSGYSGPGTAFPTDDLFLLRRVTSIPGESQAIRPAFVALLHTTLATAAPSGSALLATNAFEVERIAYDARLNGRVSVYGLGGNDAFVVDDTSAIVTLDGGAGNDSFQIGQLYGLRRDATEATGTTGDTHGGSLTPQDVFATVATTRGWLSAGVSEALLAQGGTGDDIFTVYSNQAPLRLEGDDGNDQFIVRAFALAETTGCTGGVNAAGCEIVWRDAANRVAMPRLTSGFSTAAETDIRTGGGQNQVEYNINAPVSIDGGNGIDKVVVLGTEFADHIVVTAKAIYGAGLAVTYANIELLEIDGLEGDDVFDILSTAPGVATRVIGGLGSDTINVAGDVAGDVVSRDVEGTSGVINNGVRSADPLYDGLLANGVDVTVARGTQGQVVIQETAGFTAVREGGNTDSYLVYLAQAPTHDVYVTVSAARSPQEQQGPIPRYTTASGTKQLALGDTVGLAAAYAGGGVPGATYRYKGAPASLNLGTTDYTTSAWERYFYGDTFLVATGTPAPAATDYYRHIVIDGQSVDVPQRAVVLRFTPTAWSLADAQTIWLSAVDDTLAEGDRVAVVGHSVLSGDARFDAAVVRNVEVTIHDNDLASIQVTQVDASGAADATTVVVEGTSTTELTDAFDVRLSIAPSANVTIELRPSDDRVTLSGTGVSTVTARAVGTPGVYRLTIASAGWTTATAVHVVVHAVDDAVRQDPHSTTIDLKVVPSSTNFDGAASVRVDALVIDDDTAGVVVIESGGRTLVVAGTVPTPGPGDDYKVRLTLKPTADVTIALVTDGQTDVTVGGSISLAAIGGLTPFQQFVGDLQLAGTTVTRTGSSALGNFHDEGFAAGQLIRIGGAGPYTIANVSLDGLSLTLTASAGTGPLAGTTISRLVAKGLFTGAVAYDATLGTLTRTDGTSWLDDGFLEGQLIKIGSDSTAYKIELISGTTASKLDVLKLTDKAKPAAGSVTPTSTVTQWAAVITFNDTNWYIPVTVPVVADPYFDLSPGRENLKSFAKRSHLLSGLRGPLAVEGGPTAANRGLKPAVLLPGEGNAPPFAIAPQPPEAQQVDVLNVFADSSQEDLVGTLTATTLSGLNMSGPLDFTPLLPVGGTMPFGEPSVFPGGISYGTIVFDPATKKFLPTGSTTTIEVLNVLLGEGNDRLTISGTMVPGADHNPDGTLGSVAVHGGITTVHGGGNARLEVRGTFTVSGDTITRTDGVSWASAGFAVGQQVTVNGVLKGTVTALSGAALTLSGSPGAIAADSTVAVRDPKTLATRIGGDTITITGGAGPGSPLVVYGDTSQDGLWYSGDPRIQSIRDFGTKAVPERDRQRHSELLLPGRKPLHLRRQRRDRRERAVRGCPVHRDELCAADGRVHGVWRRRRRSPDRQSDRRLPRRRLGRRRDPWPARSRLHLRRQRRQRERDHPRAFDPRCELERPGSP